MNDLPPKSVKEQLVRLDDNLKQIERKQVSGIQRAPGSLPVLEAFQAFLEAERRQARRRLMGVTVCSLAVIIVFAGVGTALIYRQTQKQGADLAGIQKRTDGLTSQLTSIEEQHDAELTALAARFSDESRRIVEQYRTLNDEQQATLGNTLTMHQSSVEALKERLSVQETENASLRTLLEALTAIKEKETPVVTPPPLTESTTTTASGIYVGTRRRRTEDDPSPPPVEPVVDVPSETPPPEVPVAEPTPMAPEYRLVTIIPRDQTQGIRWMLPGTIIQE
ncbi:MAG TPA: hypothetical protein DCS43_09310 [Verrucomicrobia bacterium]|nr:hypothetical protein [Verrucomicrobiota bacterium]